MPTRSYFVGKEFLGTGPAVHHHVHESYEAQRSEAYFCPVCAEIWARCPVDPPQPWGVTARPCLAHGVSWTEVSGSLWPVWKKPEYYKNLPKAVLYRELELTIQHREKYGQL